uniref:Embryonic testis differentiation protein homolog A n=1 Tax=Moschus moschiferus TaxID=68415 RepID=A0A8C6DG17_MOSMO
MDKESSEGNSNTPTLDTKKEEKHPKSLRVPQNVLIFLLDRQLGRHRSDVDLSRWVWMLT